MVLIQGESGKKTGKKRLRSPLHFKEVIVSQEPMSSQLWSHLQESLLESELFGHEKDPLRGNRSENGALFKQQDERNSSFMDESRDVTRDPS